VDDRRVAAGRAAALAGRGYGDAAIRALLEEEGLAEQVEDALAGLEPEAERARRLLARAGRTPKELRRLAARGFDPGVVEELAQFADEG